MLFEFSKEFVAVEVANEFKARFYQLTCFLLGVCNTSGEVVILEGYELRVQHGAVE